MSEVSLKKKDTRVEAIITGHKSWQCPGYDDSSVPDTYKELSTQASIVPS